MSVPLWLCAIVIATITKTCYAQCLIRTFVPMTVMDTCPSMVSSEEPTTSADDLNALLLLARALEMDRANSANNGIDVNGLLNTLINALVYTATRDGDRGSSAPVVSNVDSNSNWQGTVVQNYPNYGSNTQNNQQSNGGGTTSPGSSGYGGNNNNNNNNYNNINNNSNSNNSNNNIKKNNSGYKNDEGLIDLQLLGPDPDNVARLDLAGKKALGVGLGSNGGNRNDGGNDSGLSGLLGGVTGTVGGLVGGLTGDNGAGGGGLLNL